MQWLREHGGWLLLFLGVTGAIIMVALYHSYTVLDTRYDELASPTILDRNGVVIWQAPNSRGHFQRNADSVPEHVKKALLEKEDQWFYYHPGINPATTLRALFRSLTGESPGGSSTLTQQLVKILLAQESERTLTNKLKEVWYTLALEVFLDKKTILLYYFNTAYLGNQTQGFASASHLYFNKTPEHLSDTELARLLATLSRPSTRHPWTEENSEVGAVIAELLSLEWNPDAALPESGQFQDESAFEVRDLMPDCPGICHSTIDATLTRELRTIAVDVMERARGQGANSTAIAVIKLPEGELLSLIGSPDPSLQTEGAQINMALAPRPIGSTIKPFIYLKGFEKGLRPYSLVEDTEYRFPIATGFSLYPRNFDGQYRGTVSLHYALANSLNVPSVKVLEYIGLEPFYDFLEDDLRFKAIQPLESYQYGIALGGLEMDLLTLTHYLTLFPKEGILAPLTTSYNSTNFNPPRSDIQTETTITPPEYTQLVTTILQDRLTGVEEFGLRNNLNLSQANYAVKTGTSRDFHDSWVIGYTPDFAVGVWLGNTKNTALENVTGQSGAGLIWHDVMESMFASAYNQETPLAHNLPVTYSIDDSLEYGLNGDAVAVVRTRLQQERLIERPLDGDEYLFTPDTIIPLLASQSVIWYVNDTRLGEGAQLDFQPPKAGEFMIRAESDQKTEQVTIRLSEDDHFLP